MSVPVPQRLQRNGYEILLTAEGGGRSSCQGIALNRWLEDPVEDAHGWFLYLRDLDDNTRWSATAQACGVRADAAQFEADADQARYTRRTRGIRSTLTIRIDARDTLEHRQLRLHNDSDRPRRLQVSSFMELALAHAAADLGHPSFLKLFVQTACDPAGGALLATRRSRGHGERWPTLVHAMVGAPPSAWETDRLVLLGRGRDARDPALQMRGGIGNVLDAAFGLRTTLLLAPQQSVELGFLLGSAVDEAGALALARRHQAAAFASTPAFDAPAIEAALEHGFAAGGDEYRIVLRAHDQRLQRPPMPWTNVLANPEFGCIVSETGAGATWSRNSQQRRLTPWRSDAISDPHDEALYLRDEDSRAFWSPLPGPAPAPVDHEIRHGFGYSQFRAVSHQLEQEVTVFVAREAPLKVLRLSLRNTGAKPRRLAVFAYQRLVLGTQAEHATEIRSWREDELLCARSEAHPDFADGIAFTALLGVENPSYSCDRAAFLGVPGDPCAPRAVREDARLDERSGSFASSCFAQHGTLLIRPGATAVVHLLLGEAVGKAELQRLRAEFGSAEALDDELTAVRDFWRETLGGLRVTTPSTAIDAMVNGWMPYQALVCRMWARTAFYQSSGAYGYRDQLQDAGNFDLIWPERTRAQLLLHARRQFREGDVLHWWHDAPVVRGVRTRFADDLLWLAYVTARYLRSSGDDSVLDEIQPFLSAPLLDPGQDEHYLAPTEDAERASLFEHCCRALDRSLTRGAHGLPLMGTGDWNDGMNRVGREGRGESVWMGFFLYEILGGFIPLARARGDTARAARYHDYRETLRATLNDSGWDGGWYRRAYYDNGVVLGSKDSDECRIDGLAQAWSVLSGVAPAERAVLAMDAADAQLIDDAEGLIRLLTPPFANTPEDPGYIKGYVAGVRENGGQYTHAACWVIAAMARLGRRDRAAALLERLSPQWHARDAAALAVYKTEPYVIAADIYGAAPHVGRGGWTWYTGSAGWAWRVAVESVLGLSLLGGERLRLAPCVPDDWRGYRIDYRPPGYRARYAIEVINANGCSARILAASLDGAPLALSEGAVEWPIHADAATHELRIELGA